MSTAASSPVRSTSRLPPEARRRQIVEEASRLIAQSGFNAVSLTDIAEACGIRGPSVLHHFPTMNQLLAAVLAQRDLDASTVGSNPPDLSEPGQVALYLRRFVEANLALREVIRLYVVLGAEAVDPAHPAHDYFVTRRRLALAALEEMLTWRPDPATSARLLLSFWQGLESLWVADPTTDFMAVWDAFAEDFFSTTVDV